MAKAANEIPPIPVPPIEPAPAAAAVIPPLVDLTQSGASEAARPDPYAQPAANPYYQAQAQPQQPYAYQPYQPYQAGPPTGLSIASMILGIAGFFIAGASIGAIITGHLAQRSQPYARGYWLTGLITGYISVGIGALIVVLYLGVIFFAFLASATY
jgi:hypothetical protein